MATAQTPARAVIRWDVHHATVGTLSIPAARLVVDLAFASSLPGIQTVSEECWFDTGAPVSVVPFDVHHQRLAWQPTGASAPWMRQPCDIGETDVWLPVARDGGLRGPYPTLARFPRTPSPQPIPVLLGLQFLLAHRAEVVVPPHPQYGAITLP